MKRIKKDFLDKISNVSNFDEFDLILENLSNNLKGIFFEIFYKLYFVIFPNYQILYSKVYLYEEIPKKIKSKLKLPKKDKGIDGIVKTKSKEYYAVQVKYRKNKKTITFGELATFPALTFGTECENIKGGIFFTNCYDVCEELKNNKYQHITYFCFNKCDNMFWNNARNYLENEIISIFVPYTPLPHQKNILQIIKKYYEENEYGRLYLPCGTGKSLMAFFTAINILKCKKIFIVVPSLYLLSETYETWLKQLHHDKKFVYLLIGSDIDKKEDILCEYTITTNKNEIKNKLANIEDKIITITTYQSSYILKEVCEELRFKFDIGIYDEAHRTAGLRDKKISILLLNKKLSKKRLFMTATEKIYNYKINKLSKNEKNKILSMDNENIYGKIIYNYSTGQAIKDNQLVDYKILAPFITTDKYNEMLENNNYVEIEKTTYEIKLLALSLMIIEVIKDNNISHLLIFSNKNEKAKRLLEIIEQLLENEKINIFCKYLNGSDNMNKRKFQIKLFEKSEKGIISSSKIFGEGVNIPICDAVCFADNKSSTVDIIQYVGRCLRKCYLKPNKISYVIVPFILDNNNVEFFNNDNKSFFKLRKILKSLGTTNDMISEKFILKNCNKISGDQNDDTNESIIELMIGKKFNLSEFKEHILSKIYDRAGNPECKIRTKIITENKRRFLNNEELIDTKKKCLEFIKKYDEYKIPQTKNWIEFCLGIDMFNDLKNKYYYSKNDLCDSLKKLSITDFEKYKKNYTKDKKLPPPDFINDGFYEDLDEKFNINNLFKKDICLLEM